jgi:hypothetical protein
MTRDIRPWTNEGSASWFGEWTGETGPSPSRRSGTQNRKGGARIGLKLWGSLAVPE